MSTVESPVTRRQRILAMKAEGFSVRRIADELSMSKSAVQRRIKPAVPTQNFGAGHSRVRHARETQAIVCSKYKLWGNRETARQARKVCSLAKELPEVFRDLVVRMDESGRVWPAYKEAMRRLDRWAIDAVMAERALGDGA